MRLRVLIWLGAVLALSLVGSSALAAKPGGYTCGGGPIPAGTYTSLTVTGNCMFGGDLTINGNVTVADGGVLNDHAFSFADHVVINGNVLVGKDAVLGLGSYNPFAVHDTTVNGNIQANQPRTLYLTFTTVHGNVHSNGGSGPGLNFPTKDNVIDGNLIVQGWTGMWIGAIRNHVGGNVIFSRNTALDTTVVPGSDSSEIQTNVIGGNLICHDNAPTAQVNQFDGGQVNQIGGNAVGECPPRIVDNPTE